MDGRDARREDGASRVLPGHDVERLVLYANLLRNWPVLRKRQR
jgi:hypothetical protein